MESSPEAQEALRSLIAAIKTLGDGNSLDAIVHASEHAPKLERKVHDLQEHARLHEKTRQECLNDYNADRDKLREESAKLARHVEQLQMQLDTEREESKQAANEYIVCKKELQGSLKQIQHAKGILKQQERQIQGLVRARKDDKQAIQDLGVQITGLHNMLTASKTEREKLTAEHNLLGQRAASQAEELTMLQNMSAKMTDRYEIIGKLRILWSRLASVTWSHFGADLNIDCVASETFWADIRRFHWSGQIPMPSSNTVPAKQMRCLVVAAFLARMISDELFQPTYLLPADSGIREYLQRQATNHPARESQIRALLNAALPGDEDKAYAARVADLQHRVKAWLSMLLPRESLGELMNELGQIMEECHDLWQEIKCLTDCVCTSFDVTWHDEATWTSVELTATEMTIVDKPASRGPVQAQDIMLVVFPQIYTIGDEKTHMVEQAGVVVLSHQTEEATAELRKPIVNSPAQAARHVRSRSTRTHEKTTQG